MELTDKHADLLSELGTWLVFGTRPWEADNDGFRGLIHPKEL